MRGGAEIFMKRISSFQEVCIILNVNGFAKNIFCFLGIQSNLLRLSRRNTEKTLMSNTTRNSITLPKKSFEV